eukprot:UN06730
MSNAIAFKRAKSYSPFFSRHAPFRAFILLCNIFKPQFWDIYLLILIPLQYPDRSGNFTCFQHIFGCCFITNFLHFYTLAIS